MSWLKNTLLGMMTLALTLGLSGCSDDGNSSRRGTTVFGLVQFYNASAGSPKVQFEVPDITFANATTTSNWEVVAAYGKGGQRLAVSPGEYSLNVNRLDPVTGAYDSLVLSDALSVVDDVHQFVVLTGDFSAPELKTFTFATNPALGALNFEFRAYNFTSDYAQLEVLYSAEGGSLQDAVLHATLSNGGESAFEELGEGRYVFYVVNADTSELLLTTEPISFVRNTTYFIGLRDDPVTGGVQLDQLNASAFAYSYGVPQTEGQFRVYQSLEDLGAVDVTIAGDQGQQLLANVAADQFTADLALDAGNYAVTITAPGSSDQVYVENLSAQLAGGAGLDVVMLRVGEETVAVSYRRELQTNAYESAVNVMNLADVRDADDNLRVLRFYLVPSASYTGDPAVDKPLAISLPNMTVGSVVNATLLPDDYYVYIAYGVVETVDGVTVTSEVDLLDGQLISVASEANHQLIFEPDTTQSSGYRLSLY